MSSNDKSLIAGMMEGFVSEVPANPFVSFCVFCNKGVIKEEMVYEKGKVFHKDCYAKHGSSFPAVNQELLSESTNAKVQLIQLKNLQIRMMNKKSSPRKTKKKTKRTKRKSKRKTTRRKKTATRRKKTKKKTKRRATKRRISTRKKTRRKIKRRGTRAKRKTRRR